MLFLAALALCNVAAAQTVDPASSDAELRGATATEPLSDTATLDASLGRASGSKASGPTQKAAQAVPNAAPKHPRPIREAPSLIARLSFDFGYETSYASRRLLLDVHVQDPVSGKQIYAGAGGRVDTWGNGFGANVSCAILPWMDVGLDLRVRRDFVAPAGARLEQFGIRLGPRREVSAGPFLEFRPWQRRFANRRWAFFRTGLRVEVDEYAYARAPTVVSPNDAKSGGLSVWLGAGFRLPAFAGTSLFAFVDGEASPNFSGHLFVGGGFR